MVSNCGTSYQSAWCFPRLSILLNKVIRFLYLLCPTSSVTCLICICQYFNVLVLLSISFDDLKACCCTALWTALCIWIVLYKYMYLALPWLDHNKNVSMNTHNIIKDPRPHEVGHPRHLVDVHCSFFLQLAGESGEGTKQPWCSTSQSIQGARERQMYQCKYRSKL